MTSPFALRAIGAYRKASETALPPEQQRGAFPAVSTPAVSATGSHSALTPGALRWLQVTTVVFLVALVPPVAWVAEQALLTIARGLVAVAGWFL